MWKDQGHEEYMSQISGWKKQKIELEDNANVKMRELTMENKEMKGKLEELMAQQKEWYELRKKKKVWNEMEQQ